MTSFSGGVSHAVADSFDFSGVRHIVEIGGGHGYFLKTIPERVSGSKGTLFDLPGAGTGADTTRLGGDIRIVGGDSFKEVPAGGDCDTLKHINQAWSDEQCITMLSNVARAMHSDGRGLLVEMVMRESGEPHPAKFMDVNMLAMTEGGCERTEKDYGELFGKV
jgi:hypothetical protein